jgi:hypothetical protein
MVDGRDVHIKNRKGLTSGLVKQSCLHPMGHGLPTLQAKNSWIPKSAGASCTPYVIAFLKDVNVFHVYLLEKK